VEVAVSSALNFIWPAPTLKGAVILTLLTLLGTVAVVLARSCGQAFVAWVNGKNRVAEIEAAGKADIARIQETGKVLRSLADLEPDQVERLHGHLDRVRPPPDQLQPPAAS
jgi:hypothetical protein